MEAIVLKVTADTTDAERSIEALKASVNGINSSEGLQGVESALEGVSIASESASSNVETLGENVGSASSKAGSAAPAMKKMKDSIKKVGDEAKKSSSKFGSLLSALGRIALYRFLRTIIKEISQAFQEGLQNAYMFSKGIGGDLASALDGLTTKSFTMKNQLGAAFGQLLQNLMPVILTLVQWITKLADAITQFFAALGGNSTYLKAVDYQKEFAENTEKSAKKTKELRRTLMGFDVINRLNDNNNNNGGAGKNNQDYSKMFEVANLDSPLAQLGQKLKEEWDKSGIADSWEKFKKSLMDSGIPSAIGRLFETSALVNFKGALDIIVDALNLLTALLNGDLYTAVNELKNLVVDLVFGAFKSWANVIDQIFGINIVGWLEDVQQQIKDFDLSAWIKQAWEDIKKFVEEIPGWFDEKVWQPIVSFCEGCVNGVIDRIESLINSAIRIINGFIKRINNVLSLINSAFGSSLHIGELKTINLKRVSFATGGFPEDGLFFANHGEMVGQFSNGKTAVANNDQIVAGIKQGVYEAMVSANGNSKSQIAELNIDGITFARALFRYNSQVSNEHGTSLVVG